MSDAAGLAIIDDDAAVLDSLVAVLVGSGFETVRAFGSAPSFLAELERGYRPDCIVSDVRMPEMSGLELQEELRRRGTMSPLILITGHGEVSMAVRALKAGALDFIEKPFEAEALIGAIGRALRHAAERAEDERTRAEMLVRIGQLSQRQRQVMDRVVQGQSSKEIAAELGISPRTVETYRLWIMEKTGARNLAELVRMAMQIEAGRIRTPD